jgi:2-keto-4-pentenoate hydratase
LNDQIHDRGQGSNVLDGPISALQYLQHGLEKYQKQADLKSGDVVSTGTLTDAKPISPGQIWRADFEGFESLHLGVKLTRSC